MPSPPLRSVKRVGLIGLAGFFKQLDISHGGPGDERPQGVVFFGAFLFDCFYGDATGVVVDQPSVEAAPAPEPHGYSLSVPLLRQIPGHRSASPVRLRSPGILPFGPAPALVRSHPRDRVSIELCVLTIREQIWSLSRY